jgi:hypothetical protein
MGKKQTSKSTRGDKAARGLKELQQRFYEFADDQRLVWLRRPRLHTAIFEEAHEDERLSEQGGFNPKTAERSAELEKMAMELKWSSRRLKEFTQLIVRFRNESNIEDYVQIRRQFPEVDIQVGRFGGIEALFALEDGFRKQGVDPDLVAAALDGDEPSVDALSMRLLELLSARSALPKTGPRHIEMRRAAISDTTVNFLISTVLEAFDWHDEVARLPGSFVVLVRHVLCGTTPDLYKEYRSNEKRNSAAFLAAQRFRLDEKVSIRKLAERAEIPRSTAARWLADPDFQKSFDRARKFVASEEFQRIVSEARVKK